eukprot:m.158520 g.158520  ORF g.158520 m.158520 type:complete len:178 (+) comp38744_c0_seq2:30-563(+)
MASADQNGHQYVNADQQLIFIFTWNLVKSNDHFQATRLLQLFREENVIDESQERDVKDQGTPAGRSIEFLGAVYNNCRTKRGTFDKFCEVVGKKQLSVLLDHMPGVRRKGSSAHKWEFVGVDDTKEIYLNLEDKGDPFRKGCPHRRRTVKGQDPHFFATCRNTCPALQIVSGPERAI